MQLGANGRRFLRVPFATEVDYFYGTKASGSGQCRELSRGGLSMSLGRYLTPGRKILVRVFSTSNPNEAAELKGRIAWCRPTGQPERFLAGVEVFYDAPEVSEDLSRLMLEAALAHTGATETVPGDKTEKPSDAVQIRMRFTISTLAYAGFAKTLALVAAVFAAGNGA